MKACPDFNLHTHTARCRHAVGSDEAYVQAAIKAGFKVLGFSDHCPFACLRDQRDRMNIEEKAGYLNSIASLKDKYRDQITILTGYEFEYFPSLRQELQERRDETDYMILGNHYLTPGGMDFCEAAEDESVLLYAAGSPAALAEGLADYVAHPEYFMLSRDHWSPGLRRSGADHLRGGGERRGAAGDQSQGNEAWQAGLSGRLALRLPVGEVLGNRRNLRLYRGLRHGCP